tara:strand:- start:2296 stop:3045 length:750 start_codon:yes stop_codon:yes gene_type:complete
MFESSNKFSVFNRNILITGGSRGIGESISKGFLQNGANVTILDKKNPSKQNKSNFIKCDLADHANIKNSINNYIKHSSPHVLINCVAITLPNKSERYTKVDWERTLSINLSGIFYICQEVGNHMIQKKISGSIINLTSIGAEQGFENNPAYGASKAGLKQLSKSLAAEWGKFNIRVNNLVPGYTNTPMNKKSWNNLKLRNQRSANTMLNRWAAVEEMVGPAIFLASDASSYITGSDLIVDGGWLSKGMK